MWKGILVVFLVLITACTQENITGEAFNIEEEQTFQLPLPEEVKYDTRSIIVSFNEEVLEVSDEIKAYEKSEVTVRDKNINSIFDNVESVTPIISKNSKLRKLAGKTFVIKVKNEKEMTATLQKLNNNPNVAYAVPDQKIELALVPNDPLYPQQWMLENDGSNGLEDADIDAEQAWNISLGNDSLVIAVIDTGVDYTHPDLAANMWINPGEIPGNGIDDDNNGYIDDIHGIDLIESDTDPMDVHGHGTHCAGTIAAIDNNNEGIVGVCPECKIMAIRVFDQLGAGNLANAIIGIDYAYQMGADVMSNSWGGFTYDQTLQDLMIALTADNRVFVAAAGNNNNEIPWYPANYDEAIAVAALGPDNTKASYSTFGEFIDLSAPGGEVVECSGQQNCCRYPPEIAVLSTIINSSGILGTLWNSLPECHIVDNGNTYMGLSGTSMATPHVAGAAALLLSTNPELTPAQVKEILKATTDDVEQANPAYAGKLGTGRLNAHSAINLSENPLPGLVIKKVSDETGENNSLIEGTDNITLILELSNFWNNTYNDTSLELFVSNPGITLVRDYNEYGDLLPLIAVENIIPFELHLVNIPEGIINIDARINYSVNGTNYSGTKQFSITVIEDFGWPKVNSEGRSYTQLKLGDLNQDGNTEVVTVLQNGATFDGEIMIYSDLGKLIKKFPTNGFVISDPMIANFDLDPEMEIAFSSLEVYSSESNLYIFDYQGNRNSIVQKTNLGSAIVGLTAVDLEEDGVHELVYSYNNTLYVIDFLGNELWSYDHSPETTANIAHGDTDFDGENEIILSTITGQDSYTRYFDLQGNLLNTILLTDSRPTSSYFTFADINEDQNVEMIFSSRFNDNVTIVNSSGTILHSFNISSPAGISLADVNNDDNLDIIILNDSNTIYVIDESENNYSNFTINSLFSTNIPIHVGLIANIDSDPESEIIVKGFGCVIEAYNLDGSSVFGYPLVLDSASLCSIPKMSIMPFNGQAYLAITTSTSGTSTSQLILHSLNMPYTKQLWEHPLYDQFNSRVLPITNCSDYDVNCDSAVDVSDLLDVALLFRTSSSQVDVNKDGIVNILDLTLIVLNFS